MLVTMDVVYVNSVSFKHTDSCHELNYSGYKFNFLKLKQLLIDSDIEANLRPMQSGCKSPVRHPKKIKVSKGTAKKCERYKIVFSIQFNQPACTSLSHGQLLALKLWSHCKKWNLR